MQDVPPEVESAAAVSFTSSVSDAMRSTTITILMSLAIGAAEYLRRCPISSGGLGSLKRSFSWAAQSESLDGSKTVACSCGRRVNTGPPALVEK
jgi:hypothetical protein